MSIIGIDLGYTYTKTSEMIMFPSKYTKVAPLLGGRTLKIDGSTYYVGDGRGTVDLNKIDNTVTNVCLFYALGSSQIHDGVKLVTGLPIAQYQAQKDDFKNTLLTNRLKTIEIDGGREQRIYIEDVKIYPQCAGALFGQSIYSDAVVVDIGGRTVDIAYFVYQDGTRKLIKSGTLYDGMLTLFSSIISAVNTKYNLALEDEFAYSILTRGLCVDGTNQDVSFLKPIIADHIENICEHIKLNYPASTTQIYLCGGGANILLAAFQKHFKNIKTINNSQFANAIGFKKVGEAIWQTNR